MIIEDVGVLESMIKQLIELKSVTISIKAPVNINEVVLDCINVFEQDILGKGILVETELASGIPLVFADVKLIKRAFCNILKNAIEAMETGTKLLKVSTRSAEGWLEVKFSDSGIGISREKLRNIFDPMVTSKVYGPGLGLTFALRIIQYHEGTISVESEPGKGTVLLVRLPLAAGQ
jgi:two-component system, sensor histidine kinase and response regulator